MKQRHIEADTVADTLAGLQIDLLQKFKAKKRTLEDLKWFLYLSDEELLNLRLERSFIVGEKLHKLLYWGSNSFKDPIFISEQSSEIPLNSNLAPLREVAMDHSWDDEVVSRRPFFTKFEGEYFWQVLYLLTQKPDLGERILGVLLDQNKTYLLYVNAILGHPKGLFKVELHFEKGWKAKAERFNAYPVHEYQVLLCLKVREK